MLSFVEIQRRSYFQNNVEVLYHTSLRKMPQPPLTIAGYRPQKMGLRKKWDWRVNFFPKKNNPAPNHITQPPKMADLLPYDAPPLGFFWQYLSQKSSYETGARTQLGAKIRRISLSCAIAHLPRLQQHRHPFDRPLFFSIVPSSSRKLMMMV
jgi:hypothetical protein